VLVALGACACGGGSPVASAPRLLGGDASTYLLHLDEIGLPGFHVEEPPRKLTAGDIAGVDTALAADLASAGLISAATVRFLNPAPRLATANGPLDVVATVELLGSPAGAERIYAARVKHDDAQAGVQALSTGPLGDAAHAVVASAPLSDEVQAVQYTVTWRSANAVNVLVVRGRLGGFGLSDALSIARRQASRETG
jgi:hypothetical protein